MTKCLGCGATLQNLDPTQDGYVKDLSKALCERCFKIRHYNEYKFIDKSNDYYLSIIKKIEKTNDLVLLVTDFLNTESLNEIKIKNPVILVLAKRDLIPRSLDENKLLNKISTKLNIVDKIIVGSQNNYNLDLLYNKINKHKLSNNVYVIGYTNAGKSTLINKLIKNYSHNAYQITTSILPSTTLDLIEVPIDENLTIIDTPGLLDKGSIIQYVDAFTLNKIIPKEELKPVVIQVKTPQCILVDSLMRLDVRPHTVLIFYLSKSLKLERYYKPTHKLQHLQHYIVDIKGGSDLVIKGLGFIKITQDTQIEFYLDEHIKYVIRPSII